VESSNPTVYGGQILVFNFWMQALPLLFFGGSERAGNIKSLFFSSDGILVTSSQQQSWWQIEFQELWEQFPDSITISGILDFSGTPQLYWQSSTIRLRVCSTLALFHLDLPRSGRFSLSKIICSGFITSDVLGPWLLFRVVNHWHNLQSVTHISRIQKRIPLAREDTSLGDIC